MMGLLDSKEDNLKSKLSFAKEAVSMLLSGEIKPESNLYTDMVEKLYSILRELLEAGIIEALDAYELVVMLRCRFSSLPESGEILRNLKEALGGVEVGSSQD